MTEKERIRMHRDGTTDRGWAGVVVLALLALGAGSAIYILLSLIDQLADAFVPLLQLLGGAQ